VSVATAGSHADSVEAFSGPARRRRGKSACTAKRSASCHGCRIGPVSLCAALSEVGGDVVPPFKMSERFFPADRVIFEQCEVGREFCVIVCGWAVQFELVPDGRRQILDFLLPGSIAGFQPDGEARSSCGVQALTGVRACWFSTERFFDAAKSNPALALRLAALANRSNHRSLRRLTLIGRRTAKERVAALLLDLYRQVRRWWVSPRDDEISLPLTQEHIGDALGLTSVHVNRMLRELREEGVLVLTRGVLRLLDPGRLVEIVGGDGYGYGYMRNPSPAMSEERRNQHRLMRQAQVSE